MVRGVAVLLSIFRSYIGAASFTGRGNELANTLLGGAGNDSLVGLAGDDVLMGNAGEDVLSGDAGNDVLSGGIGSKDIFVYASGGFGNDVITDFEAGAAVMDVLRFNLGSAYDNFTKVMAACTQSGSNAVFNFGDLGSVTLNGVNKANLAVNDFLFA